MGPPVVLSDMLGAKVPARGARVPARGARDTSRGGEGPSKRDEGALGPASCPPPWAAA